MLDLAIVGGGPGGLMSAWYLKKKLGDLCRVTIYEASDRVGGKIVSRKFDSAPATIRLHRRKAPRSSTPSTRCPISRMRPWSR